MICEEQYAFRDQVLAEFEGKLFRHTNTAGMFRINPNKHVHFDTGHDGYHFIVQVERDGEWLDFSRGTVEEIKRYLREIEAP